MKTQMFATLDNAETDTQNIGGLNKMAVRRQMTKLPLQRELLK
jgi:hypothetical protein